MQAGLVEQSFERPLGQLTAVGREWSLRAYELLTAERDAAEAAVRRRVGSQR